MFKKTIGAAALLAAAYLTAPGAGAQLPTQSEEERQAMMALGSAHDTAFELYETLRERAGGGDGLEWDALPDWSGLWSRPIEHIALFDPTQSRDRPPTAQLTPEYQAMLDSKLELVSQGFEYDRLGRCDPPGVPRWFTEPFLREQVVTPDQTWLLNEVANEVRRVYTDGREHLPAEDRFATWDGDSIGFWDDGRLVIHTTQLSPGEYTRGQPDHTDQVEVVEIWQKVDEDSIVVDVWAYDPPALAEPWYVRQHYEKLSNEDGNLRIHYWHCFENQNNDVFETDEGGTDFVDFDFTDVDDN
ncbi:hypothetical protein [Candidatus Rariloculus sp.]|uniref:hypothetical protein n=1 Tax=Candidatus Rariloculus sp. TaxID=3101265 RepID=UPI003D1165DB